MIVGFCDETDQDFQETIDLVNYARFDMIYIGIYSTRPGTFAARKYEDNIPKEIKQQRRTQLNDLLRNISKENNQTELGRTRDVLVTNTDGEQIAGYTDNMKQILIDKDTNTTHIKAGDFISAKINRGEHFKLFGQML